MASVFEKIAKRATVPVPDCDGVFVREPIYGEVRRVRAVDDDGLRTALTLAICVVNASGEREYVPLADEKDIDFAKRVQAITDELPPWVVNAISKEIERIVNPAKPISVETIAKN